MTEQTRQYQAMAKTASWTMVSRVLGLFRDQLTAAIFGASAIGSAFILAFQIPNLFRRLLGEGALTAAIVPVLAACSNLSQQQENAAIGAGVGAIGGSILTGGSTLGTLGGAAIGGVIGHGTDGKRR
mgnify:CR=1 FL=1